MGGSWLEAIKTRFEETFHPAHLIAGVCKSPNLEQVKDLLEHGESLIGKAKTTTAFANYTQALGSAGEKLDGAVGELDELVKTGAKVSGDVSAACEISEAIAVLNQWNVPGSKVSNEEAAKAFDQLFGGAARYFEKLPFPASAYAQILKAVRENNFFTNMSKLLDPENPNTPAGQQLRNLRYDGS